MLVVIIIDWPVQKSKSKLNSWKLDEIWLESKLKALMRALFIICPLPHPLAWLLLLFSPHFLLEATLLVMLLLLFSVKEAKPDLSK